MAHGDHGTNSLVDRSRFPTASLLSLEAEREKARERLYKQKKSVFLNFHLASFPHGAN